MAGWKNVAWMMLLASLVSAGFCRAAEKKVLVYTRQGLMVDGKKGFIHNNTKAAVEAVQAVCAEIGVAVDVSEDPAVFTDANLKQYQALIFSNTNNQIFDTEAQQAALQKYVRSRGGIVGIHSSTASMRAWPWFAEMMGGRFLRHPKLQPFTIKVMDRNHPSTCFLGETWKWEDEFYYHKDLSKNLHVLLAGDLSTLSDTQKPTAPDNLFPLAWCQQFEGARVFFTALGHKPEYYSDPQFRKHILGGLRWVLDKK